MFKPQITFSASSPFISSQPSFLSAPLVSSQPHMLNTASSSFSGFCVSFFPCAPPPPLQQLPRPFITNAVSHHVSTRLEVSHLFSFDSHAGDTPLCPTPAPRTFTPVHRRRRGEEGETMTRGCKGCSVCVCVFVSAFRSPVTKVRRLRTGAKRGGFYCGEGRREREKERKTGDGDGVNDRWLQWGGGRGGARGERLNVSTWLLIQSDYHRLTAPTSRRLPDSSARPPARSLLRVAGSESVHYREARGEGRETPASV